MKQLEINDVAKETLDILKYFDANIVSKIPINFLNLLSELAQKSNKVVNIDKNKKLKEQNISEESKDLISLIYYNYIATGEEKEKILKIWNKNETLYQKQISEKYSIEKIFQKNNGRDYAQENSNLPTVISKENLIQKIINFLKRIFNKN